MAPQYARSERVERPGPHALGRLPQQTRDSVSQLTRGLVGEGERGDVARFVTAVLDQVRDLLRDHAGLARTGTGQHQLVWRTGGNSVALAVV